MYPCIIHGKVMMDLSTGYVPTRRLSVVVIDDSGIWMDGHRLAPFLRSRSRDIAIEVLRMGARQRGAPLTARVIDKVERESMTLSVGSETVSVIDGDLNFRDALENGRRDTAASGEDDFTDARAESAKHCHLTGLYTLAAMLWLDLAKRSWQERSTATADHLARAAAAWQRNVPSEIKSAQARGLLRCWSAAAGADLLRATDREMAQEVRAVYVSEDGHEAAGDLRSLFPSVREERGKAASGVVLHSGVIGGSGASHRCICFIAACGATLHHPGTARLCPWHAGHPVEQHHLTTRCSATMPPAPHRDDLAEVGMR